MFNVISNTDDSLGSFPTVNKARKAIEEYYQCGINESTKELKATIKSLGSATAFLCMNSSYNCTITEA